MMDAKGFSNPLDDFLNQAEEVEIEPSIKQPEKAITNNKKPAISGDNMKAERNKKPAKKTAEKNTPKDKPSQKKKDASDKVEEKNVRIMKTFMIDQDLSAALKRKVYEDDGRYSLSDYVCEALRPFLKDQLDTVKKEGKL